MKVSVSIVCFQQADTIAQAVESALNQQAPFPVEIVVGDDASTDGTQDVLCDLARRHPTVRPILADRNYGDRGLSNLRATIEAARGEYVAFLDGDDFWTAPDKLARQVALLDDTPDCPLSAHRVRHLGNGGTARLSPSPGPGISRQDVGALIIRNFCPKISVVVRRSALMDLPEWYWTCGSVSMDWILNVLVANDGGIIFINEAMATHRIHGSSMSSVLGSDRMLSDKIEILGRLRDHVPGRDREFSIARRRFRTKRLLLWASPRSFRFLKAFAMRRGR